MFIDERLGLSRDQMPQFDDGAGAGFRAYLRDLGVTVSKRDIAPEALGKTQKAVNGPKVQGMIRAYKAGDFPDLVTGRIMVSSDSYVLDGHHRWAALRQMRHPMPVWWIDMPIDRLVQAAVTYLSLHSAG